MQTYAIKPASQGAFFIFISAILFSINILLVKILRTATSIPVVEITFARFFIGLIIVVLYLKVSGAAFKPVNKKVLYLRGLLNAAAVLILFFAVEYTTITNANVLNMTYPIFVALFSHALIGERFHPSVFIPLFLTAAGVYMVIQPDFSQINGGDFIGLISGIVAALAIIYLRVLRRTDETHVILFYLFAVGSILLLIPTIPLFVMPDKMEFLLLALCSLCGVAAQYFLTHGYKFISAVGGSIVSASRVYIASLLGVVFFNDPVNAVLFMGTLLIVGSNVLTAGIESSNGNEKR
ncbi:MAG: DMT family transporter [Deltaproteobacteria bacterium]|nr:DMT family transporter [Deltaproteobacteria bacterium]